MQNDLRPYNDNKLQNAGVNIFSNYPTNSNQNTYNGNVNPNEISYTSNFTSAPPIITGMNMNLNPDQNYNYYNNGNANPNFNQNNIYKINNQIPNGNNQFIPNTNNNNQEFANNLNIYTENLPVNSMNYNPNNYNSPEYYQNMNNHGRYTGEILNEENSKKKNLMENIQQQIANNKNTKVKELERKRAEDQKYLSELNNNFPFGKNGAGAPLRDSIGNIITKRKTLISDNKNSNEEKSNINNIISDITQRIASGKNIIPNNGIEPRYNSARNSVRIKFPNY